LPSSNVLSFISQGSLSLGKIDFVEAGADEQDVLYNITVGYHAKHVLEMVKVCLLHEENNNGVGIFTLGHKVPVPHEDKVFFSVQVKLPAVKYRALVTDFLQFTQTFYALNSPIKFDTVTLKGVNAPIYVEDHAVKYREIRVQFSKGGSGTAKSSVLWVGKYGDHEEKEVGNSKIGTAYGEARLAL